MAIYTCSVCFYKYDSEREGTAWEDLGDDWKCPVCGATLCVHRNFCLKCGTKRRKHAIHTQHRRKSA